MKRIGLWERFFRFVYGFFGIGMLKSILAADSGFFGEFLNEEDDMSDSEFRVTDRFVIRFREPEGKLVPLYREGDHKISA